MRTETRRRSSRLLVIAGATAFVALTLFTAGGFLVAPLVLLTVALDISFLRPRGAAPGLSLAGEVRLDNVSLREACRPTRWRG